MKTVFHPCIERQTRSVRNGSRQTIGPFFVVPLVTFNRLVKDGIVGNDHDEDDD